MNRFLAPNLERKGRLVRGLMGLALLLGAAFSLGASIWLTVLLAAAGGFVLFEAFRGWCVVRACGVRTKL